MDSRTATLALLAALLLPSAHRAGGVEALAAATLEKRPDLEALGRALGSDAAGSAALLEVLLSGTVPAVAPLEAPRALRDDLRAVLLSSLATGPRVAWRPALTRLAESEADTAARAAALDLLGAGGTHEDRALFALLVRPSGESEPPYEVVCAVRRAAAAWARRAPQTVATLVRDSGNWPTTASVALIDALGDAPSDASLDQLAQVVWMSPLLRAPALAAFARCAAALPGPFDEGLRRIVRASLGDRDPFIAAQAAAAVGAIEDHESVPELIAMLAEQEHVGAASAAAALRAIAGVDFGLDPEAWESWYESELAHWTTEVVRAEQQLGARDPTVVLRAIRTIASGRLYRHERADLLLPVLDSSDPAVVVLTCKALAGLGSPRALPDMLRLLASELPAVSGAAHHALRSITGLDLPPMTLAWQQALSPQLP